MHGLIFFTNVFAGGGSHQFNHFLAELTARANSQAAGAAAVGMGKFLCGIFGCAPTIYMSVNDLTKKELCEIIEFVVGKVCCYVEEYGNLRTSMY